MRDCYQVTEVTAPWGPVIRKRNVGYRADNQAREASSMTVLQLETSQGTDLPALDFQPAKKPIKKLGFLQKIDRIAFRVSRLTEFCSLKELVNQTGHQV